MKVKSFVKFDNVGKWYGENWVFRGLNLELPSEQTVAIVGESGSGKTTMLQLVNGVVRADEGEVSINNRPIPESNLHKFRRNMGYSVQGGGLFPHMTLYRNVTLLAKLEKWSSKRCEERFEELMDFMGLELELRDRYAYQLSGGQQHRVSLCRAMMLQPEVLLLDEPFSAIDPMTRAEIHEAFIALQKKEMVSTLLVTHDLREAISLSHYMIIMANGTVVQHGVTEEVLADPDPTYVAPLLEAHV